MPRSTLRIDFLAVVLALALGWPAAQAAAYPGHASDSRPDSTDKDAWCDQAYSRHDEDWHRFCEVREIRLPARKAITVDAGRNGGVQIVGWERDHILVWAKVETWGDDDREAAALAKRIEVKTGSTIEAEGPGSDLFRRDGRSWAVSYRIFVPRTTGLSLSTHNGGITVHGVAGRMDLEALNGGLSLEDVGGDVRARTTNGGVSVQLTGRRWNGAGLDVQTTNGGVSIALPDDYSAKLEAGTTNGRIHLGFPVTVSGPIGRHVSATLGSGGPTLRVVTTNGGVSVRRADASDDEGAGDGI